MLESEHVAWVADVPRSADIYLAIFNTTDENVEQDSTATVALRELGYANPGVRDLWLGRDLGAVGTRFAPRMPRHGAALYRVAR